MTDATQLRDTVHKWMDTFMHRSMGGWARYIKGSGLSMSQFFILMHLRHNNQCGISDISERMETTNAAASQLVDKLVQSGLLERVEDPNDRRAKQVSLSSKGEKLIEKGINERYRWMDQLEAGLSAEEMDKVSEALEILIRAVEPLETPPAHK